MARYTSQFTGKEIDNRLAQVNERWGAAYFDATTYRWLGFKSEEDKAEWLSSGDDSLIVGSPVPFSFSGTVSQIKIINEMESGNLYYTTKNEKVLLTCSFLSQEKGITDSAWTDVIEDFYVSVAVDRGGSGDFADLIVDQLVLNGNSLTFDVRNMLATGTNRVRVVARGAQSSASASFTYTVNMTSMFLSPSNFTWYTPFIEGATYNLGGMNIGGNLQKILKVKVTKEGYEKIYEVNIGSATYITNAYTFTGLEFPTAGTGIYNVELWLDANGLESEHLKYNIICVAAADQYTARLISVSEQPDKVFNFAENSLFKYAIYNAGAATGTPHVKVSSIVKATPTVLVDEDLVDVPTGAPLDYTVAIEIETEEADVQLDAVITFGNEQQTIYAVDNSKSYPATSGAVFYINPAIRSNAQENKDKIVNAIDSKVYDATFERMAWTDGTDGWTTDNAGRKCLRLPASSTCTIPYQPFAKMSGSKTIEFTYKVENAADYTEPIITICDDPTSADFRGIKITPKAIAIHSRDLKDTELQNYKPTDEETLNVIISIVPNYKTNYGNLVKVWCNGSPVREFSFANNDSWLQSGNIILGSQTADVYLYKMRVYESAFGAPNAMQNFVNSLPTAEDKANAQAQIDKAINDSYQLDYDACVKAGLNTMVIEMLGESVIPNLLNPSSGQCNLWVNIYNKIEGELDEEMSALLSGTPILDQTIEGQGTTAMTYFRWNFRWKLGSAYGKRRITAKKNVASSMHSHKMGATRMFNHLHRAVVGENIVGKDVAVSQYPVFGFQKVLIEGTTDQYNYVPIGLYTIGADKGDKPTFGFDDKTYKNSLMHLEGTDHTPMAVGMDYPWSATRYDASKEAMGAIGNTGDVVAAWEVGAAGEYEPDATADQANVQAMLDAEFKPAYDVAYKNSPYILGVTETLAQINSDVAGWRRRTTADGKSYSLYEFYTIGTYDVYYYNTQSQKYEANGINLLTDLGLSSGATNEDIINARKVRFKATWGNYWNTDDSIFHYTFCMIFAATDNYKKNTYPYKFRPLANGGRWAWRADDLDTLFDINNQGLAAKVYSVLVGDQTSTGSGSIYRGDTSAFWTLIKETCQDEIKAMVHRIFNAMVSMSPYGNNILEKLVGCVRRFFWDFAQDYFSAAAYNNDTEWTYEDTWATAGAWKEVNPLSQALGGHYEAERDWVTMRVLFLASYYNYGPFGTVNDSFSDTSTGQLVYGGAGQHTFEITPAIDFNPTILRGQSELVTVGERVKAGETVDLTVPDSSGADTRIYVQGADWFKSIGDLSQLQVSADNPSLSVASKRMQELKVGDEVADNVTSNLKTLNMGANPSMMVVDARNLTSLSGNVDLTQLPRLREALFGGTDVRSIGIASGSKIEHLQFGNGTTSLTLQNLKFLESLELGDSSKIEFFRVENCAGFNSFELLKTAYNLDSQALKDIRIIGFVYDGDSTDADMLANFANDLDKNGNEHAYNGINSEGAPMPDALPVIEGTLNIDGSIYEDAAEAIRANYPNLTLIVEGGYYIRFADPVVQQICATNWGDGAGTGITKEQAAKVTTFDNKFKGNTEMTSFEEARHFTGLTTLDTAYSPQFDGNTSLTKISFRDARLSSSDFAMCSTFRNCSQLSEIDMTNMFVDGQVVSMYNTFRGTAITNFKFPKMTYKHYIFGGDSCALFHSCKNLVSVDMSELTMDFSTGRPANASYPWSMTSLFHSCEQLSEIIWPSTQIIGCVGFNATFSGCKSLQTFVCPPVDTSVWTYLDSAFMNCTNMRTIDLTALKGTSIVRMYKMCNGAENLQEVIGLEGINGVNVDVYSAFSGCKKLKEADLSGLTSADMQWSFNGCSSIEKITLPSVITANTTNWCSSCTSLKTITSKAPVDVSAITNFSAFFAGASNFENLPEFIGINVSFSASGHKNLTRQSLLNLINGLADRTGQSALTMTIGSTNLAKLSDEDKAIATAKNWTLA